MAPLLKAATPEVNARFLSMLESCQPRVRFRLDCPTCAIRANCFLRSSIHTWDISLKSESVPPKRVHLDTPKICRIQRKNFIFTFFNQTFNFSSNFYCEMKKEALKMKWENAEEFSYVTCSDRTLQYNFLGRCLMKLHWISEWEAKSLNLL
jgi:hypothetical protein